MFINSFIGLVLICNGACSALSSYVFGALVKYIGRIGCFIIAAVLNYATIILMYLWEPLEGQMIILYIIAGLWGIADAVWQSQVIGIIIFYIIFIFGLIIYLFQPLIPFFIQKLIQVL